MTITIKIPVERITRPLRAGIAALANSTTMRNWRLHRQLIRDAKTVYRGIKRGELTGYWTEVRNGRAISHVEMPIGRVAGREVSLAGARGLMEMRGRASR